MLVKKITVSKGVTVSVGQYESIRIDALIEIEAEKGEDEDMLFETGFDIVDEKINAQIQEIQDVVGDKSVFKAESKKAAASRKR